MHNQSTKHARCVLVIVQIVLNANLTPSNINDLARLFP